MPFYVELSIDGIRLLGRRAHVFEASPTLNPAGFELLIVKHAVIPLNHRALLQTGRYAQIEGPVRILPFDFELPPAPAQDYTAPASFYVELFASDRMVVIHPARGNGFQVFKAEATGGNLVLLEWFGNPALERIRYSPVQYHQVEGPARVLSSVDYQEVLSGPLQEATRQEQTGRL